MIEYKTIRNGLWGGMDRHGNLIEPDNWNQQYQGQVIYRGGTNEEITNSGYSDRIKAQYHDQLPSVLEELFNNEFYSFNRMNSDDVENLLKKLLNDDTLKLILIERYHTMGNHPYYNWSWKSKTDGQ